MPHWLSTVLECLVAGVVTGLIYLLRWQRITDKKVALLETAAEETAANTQAIQELEDKHQAHVIESMERYVRRDDYIQQVALLASKMDAQGEMLARVDERSRRWNK